MSVDIRVPALGESVVEATVREWLKQEGEPVAAGDVLVRLETDKVDLEVSAEAAGVLAQIAKGPGEDVQVGDVLGVIGEGDRSDSRQSDSRQSISQAGRPAASASGEEAPTPQEGEEAAVPAQPAPAPFEGAPSTSGDESKVTPLARRIADELDVDITHVSGTGPGGRVTREDVEAFARSQSAASAAPAAVPAAPPAAAPAEPAQHPPASPTKDTPTARPPASASLTTSSFQPSGRAEKRVRLSRRRQTIARRLVEAQHAAAILTTFNEVDMSAVMDFRARHKESFREQHGVSLGLMSFFVKASIGSLKAFPQVNAELQGDELVLKQYYDIGIAVGAAEGLVVPVLRDADHMSFAEIERVIESLVQKSQAGTLSLEDLRGGTYTITNGGVFGSLLSTPILNPPQVAILGMHKIEPRPIAVKGEVVICPMMYVALSYDHRVIDGREAVQFLVRLKQLVEDPEELLLGG
jgi:2-oxoglutarate dehydrogenase E2 component (dihydrolipoamide succinyltransferase)